MTPFADTPGCDIVAAPQRPGGAGTTDERAVGSWAGRKVCMKATSAVTSAGVRFFPYAGMLPPPWST